MAADLLGEFVVREIKAWKTATITDAGGGYLRTVMAPQVLYVPDPKYSIS